MAAVACNSSCAANPVADGTDALPGLGAPATAGLLSPAAALSRAMCSCRSPGILLFHAVERLHRAAFLLTAQSAARHPHGLCLPHAEEAVAARSFLWPNRRRPVPRASAGLQTPRRRSRPAFSAGKRSGCGPLFVSHAVPFEESDETFELLDETFELLDETFELLDETSNVRGSVKLRARQAPRLGILAAPLRFRRVRQTFGAIGGEELQLGICLVGRGGFGRRGVGRRRFRDHGPGALRNHWNSSSAAVSGPGCGFVLTAPTSSGLRAGALLVPRSERM